MIENTGVTKEQVQEPRTFGQLERVAALVRQERAHVNGKVLLIRQWRGQRQREAVVIRPLVSVDAEAVGRPVDLGHLVLPVVVGGRDGALNFGRALPTHPRVLLVHIVVIVVLLLTEKMHFFVGIEVSQVRLLEGQRTVGRGLFKFEAGQKLFPAIISIDLRIMKMK